MILKRNYFLLLLFSTAMFLTSCSDDDDSGTPPVVNPTGSLQVGDQAVMNGMITIDNVMVSDDSWVVIYRDGAGTQDNEVLGSTHVEAGNHDDVMVELDDVSSITDGETLWAALHVDSDEDGILDWDGTTGGDVAITNASDSFVVTVDEDGENAMTVEDQAVVDNTLTVSNVQLAGAGWVVVHADNDGSPGEVIGVSDVLAMGSSDDVAITLDESAEVAAGDTLWIMLHNDTGEDGVYEFDGENGLDLPVMGDDNTPVMTSITVTE